MALEFLIAAAGAPLAHRARVKWDRYGPAGAWLRVALAILAAGIPATALGVAAEEAASLFDFLAVAPFMLLAAALWSAPCALLLRWLLKPIKQAEEQAEGVEG